MAKTRFSPSFPLFVSLKDCARKKDLHRGYMLHAEILERGLLERNPYLASSLISMYAKCDSLPKAQEVLEDLPVRDTVSWNALISGYTQQGRDHEALSCFDWMQNEGLPPDAVTFTCILKACGSIRDVDKGKQIHNEMIKRSWMEKDIVLGTALVDMYAKCGLHEKAEEVLKELPIRDVVSWSAIIAGYAEHGQYQKALNSFEQMQSEHLFPDGVTFICILKVCGTTRAVEKGKQIHEEILSRGLLDKDVVLGNALVDMYVKCGLLAKAQEVLEELHIRDIVSWNTLLSGYAEQGQGHEPFVCLKRMQSEGLSPDAVTFTCILKACGRLGTVDMGIQVHEEIVSRDMLKDDVVLGNALVDMYAKCGIMEKAQRVLEELPIQNIVVWNTLIGGYAQQGQYNEALECFNQLQRKGLTPDAVTFLSFLKAVGSARALDKGKEIHEEIVNRGFLTKDIILATSLVDMYAKCGLFVRAEQVLNELPIKNVVTWNALIEGYAQYGQGDGAMNCYNKMIKEGFVPDVITYGSVLKACGNSKSIDHGKQIHDEIMRMGLLKRDVALNNALVDMYTKCGAFDKAQELLEELPTRGLVAWSTLITGYAQQGKGYEALECAERMRREGLYPDATTFTGILKACGDAGAIEKGKEIHEEILSNGLLDKDATLCNALLDMYIKCGNPAKAQQVLQELPVRSVVSWNVLIGGYAQQLQSNEALNCLEWMVEEGLVPDAMTFICALKACGNIGAKEKGKQIHDEILCRGLLENDIVLGNALVDMYAKCHMVAKARQVLEELPVRNVISWNSLIAGYAQQRQGFEAMDCFRRMQTEGLLPDEVTLLCILTACNRSGLLHVAQMLFCCMTRDYGITPSIEHHTCMVVGFGFAGQFDKAMSVIEAMPFSDNPTVWLALLGTCRKWGNVKLGKVAFDRVLQLDKTWSGAYVLMASIYTGAGLHEEAEKLEALMLRNAAWNNKQGNLIVA